MSSSSMSPGQSSLVNSRLKYGLKGERSVEFTEKEITKTIHSITYKWPKEKDSTTELTLRVAKAERSKVLIPVQVAIAWGAIDDIIDFYKDKIITHERESVEVDSHGIRWTTLHNDEARLPCPPFEPDQSLWDHILNGSFDVQGSTLAMVHSLETYPTDATDFKQQVFFLRVRHLIQQAKSLWNCSSEVTTDNLSDGQVTQPQER